jgi:8-oxo-dGTP pyrophosphatase MutT (NUDIX family)
MMPAHLEIIHLKGVDARYDPAPWPFAEERKAEIDAIWAKASAGKPQLFNGTVPLSNASFIAWPQLGKPGPERRNGFAMAALRSADGAFILGVMGPQTYNAGKIYFAGGTPDMEDVTEDGRVDLATSMVRELKEETGLRDEEFAIDANWTLVADGHRAAFLKPARLVYTADEARRVIRSRLAATDQELADVAVVRRPQDIDEAMMPDFAKAYMRAVFAAA